MCTKSMKFVTVKDFIHLGGTTYEIVAKFKKLIEKEIIDINNVELATIKYDTRISDVETGPGSGPTDLCTILKICGFKFNESDILEKQTEVNLKYIKNPSVCYQFINYDGSYIYSI